LPVIETLIGGFTVMLKGAEVLAGLPASPL
jgi:hypothetical protein